MTDYPLAHVNGGDNYEGFYDTTLGLVDSDLTKLNDASAATYQDFIYPDNWYWVGIREDVTTLPIAGVRVDVEIVSGYGDIGWYFNVYDPASTSDYFEVTGNLAYSGTGVYSLDLTDPSVSVNSFGYAATILNFLASAASSVEPDPPWLTTCVQLHFAAGDVDASPTRVSEVRVIAYTAAEPASYPTPALRQWPRSDGLGLSSARRVWPPPRSIQRSQRPGPGAHL